MKYLKNIQKSITNNLNLNKQYKSIYIPNKKEPLPIVDKDSRKKDHHIIDINLEKSISSKIISQLPIIVNKLNNNLKNILSKLFHANNSIEQSINSYNFGEYHSISELLPYRVYDEVNKLYINKNSIGFILETAPLTGADKKTVNILTSMITNGVPKDCTVQFTNWASPKIDHIIDKWAKPREEAGGVYKKLAQKRAEFLKRGAYKSLLPSSEFTVKDFRLFISASIPAKSGKKAIKQLTKFKDSLKSTLKSINMIHHKQKVELEPEGLINFLDEILNPCFKADKVSDNDKKFNNSIKNNRGNPNLNSLSYNPLNPIHTQIASPETQIEITPDGLNLSTGLNDSNNNITIRSYSVRNYPELWAQWENTDLIGSFMDDFLRMECPFMTSFSFTVPDESKMRSKASMKSARSAQQAGTEMAKYIPDIKKKERDWKFVMDKMNAGQKLVKSFYNITILSPSNKIDDAEQKLISIYKSNGWMIAREKYIQLQSFISNLPFTQSEGLSKDLERLERYKTMVTWTCANIAPLQGEWKGMLSPSLMLIGRRGQPFFWHPFDNDEGNYNVAVIGKSGSGKSVFMQELVTSFRGAGGKIYVIDDGRSFMRTCLLQGGNFVAFDSKNPICLNPFSLINKDEFERRADYRADIINLISLLVEQMCYPKGGISPFEQKIIEEAVIAIWNLHKTEATISHLKEYFKTHTDNRAKDLSTMVSSFAKGGKYDSYFEGTCNLQIDNPFMVFELAELKNKKDLQGIVMMILMFIISEKMYLGDRQTPVSLIIDEAWDLLQGGDAIGKFIEGFARRARKYGGNLITGTQSVNDYFKNPASKASMENSDFMCFLSQKKESIADLERSKKVVMNNTMKKALESLKMQDKEYSEIMVYGPKGWAIGRLILDRYSLAIYSSKAEDFRRIEQLQEQGYKLEEAIEMVAEYVR